MPTFDPDVLRINKAARAAVRKAGSGVRVDLQADDIGQQHNAYNVAVTDDSGNEYPCGCGCIAWTDDAYGTWCLNCGC